MCVCMYILIRACVCQYVCVGESTRVRECVILGCAFQAVHCPRNDCEARHALLFAFLPQVARLQTELKAMHTDMAALRSEHQRTLQSLQEEAAARIAAEMSEKKAIKAAQEQVRTMVLVFDHVPLHQHRDLSRLTSTYEYCAVQGTSYVCMCCV